MEISPNVVTILKMCMTLPIVNCEAEKNFSKLSVVKKKKKKKYLGETCKEGQRGFPKMSSLKGLTDP